MILTVLRNPGHVYGAEMATCSSILAWKIPWTEETSGLQSMEVAKNWTWLRRWTFTHSHVYCRTSLNWNLSDVFLIFSLELRNLRRKITGEVSFSSCHNSSISKLLKMWAYNYPSFSSNLCSLLYFLTRLLPPSHAQSQRLETAPTVSSPSSIWLAINY